MSKKVPGRQGNRFGRGGPAGKKPMDSGAKRTNANADAGRDADISWLNPVRDMPHGGSPRGREHTEPAPKPRRMFFRQVGKDAGSVKGKAKGRDSKR